MAAEVRTGLLAAAGGGGSGLPAFFASAGGKAAAGGDVLAAGGADGGRKAFPGLAAGLASAGGPGGAPDTAAGWTARDAALRVVEALYLSDRLADKSGVAVLVLLLLVRATAPDAKDADVKRLWPLRGALQEFDFEDESAAYMRSLLVAAYAHPAFMRNADNRRFLGYVLGALPPLARDIYGAIAASLPAPARTAEAYGEVVFRGWAAAAEGEARSALEVGLLQDLVGRAAHAACPETFKSVRRLLGVVGEHKKTRGVDAALLRAYEPIVFRALAAPNAAVRKNAALLFFDAFPLRDPDLPKRDLDALLQRQFNAMGDALADACPAVREVAVGGVAAVLGKYWELIPPAVSTSLLARLTDEASLDARAPAVRAAVPPALTSLLQQVLCLPTLATLLPRAAHLLHDRSERVRAGFVKLLAAVGEVKALSVLAVVPLDALLARLTLDAGTPAVALPLARLLVPHIVPEGADHATLLRRVVTLLSSHEAAMYVFFSAGSAALTPESVALLVQLLHRAMVLAVATRNARLLAPASAAVAAAATATGAGAGTARGRGRAGSAGGKRSRAGSAASGGDDATPAASAAAPPAATKMLDAGNLRLMAALARGASILWADVAPALLAAGEDTVLGAARRATLAVFGGDKLAGLLHDLTGASLGDVAGAVMVAGDSREDGAHTAAITASLLAIAAAVPPSELTGLSSALWERLLVDSDTAAAPAAAAALPASLGCLAAWGESARLLSAATTSLAAAVATVASPTAAGTMDATVAVAAVEHVLVAAFTTPGAGGVAVEALQGGMQALPRLVHAAASALAARAPLPPRNAARLAHLATLAAQAWARVTMAQLNCADATPQQVVEAVAALVGEMGVLARDHVAPAGVHFADAVERGVLDAATAAALAPLDVAARRVLAVVLATAADMVALGYGVPASAAMFVACSSEDALRVVGGEHSYTAMSVVEWLAGDDDDDGSGAAAMPAAYAPLLRLGVRLMAASHAPGSLPPGLRRELHAGVMRLLNLAPFPESAAADEAAAGGTAAAARAVDALVAGAAGAVVADCLRGSRAGPAADPALLEFLEAALPHAEAAVPPTAPAIALVRDGAAVLSPAALDAAAVGAVVTACVKGGPPATAALAQAVAQRLNVLASAEKGAVTPPVLALLALASAFVSACPPAAGLRTAAATLATVLAHSRFAHAHPAIAGMQAQLDTAQALDE